jgi:hypothetical protein
MKILILVVLVVGLLETSKASHVEPMFGSFVQQPTKSKFFFFYYQPALPPVRNRNHRNHQSLQTQ